MKKYGIWIVLGLVLLLFVNGCDTYNGFVKKEKEVENTWAKVQSAYQLRYDLIPNLEATVKGAANFEKNTLTEVIEARNQAKSINIEPSQLNDENYQKFMAAQQKLSSSMGSAINVVVERYPQLTATQNFIELQTQLDRIEKRIKIERDNFSEAVKTYNTAIAVFPGKLYAGMFGFEEKEFFKATKGSEEAPRINLDLED